MSRSADPSYEKLEAYIKSYYPDLKSVDRGQAIYWFSTHYGKPGSNLYEAARRFAFSGVPLLGPPKRGDAAWQPYQMLSVTYAPFGQPRDPNKAEKHERQGATVKKIRAKRVYKRKPKAKSFNPRHLPMPKWYAIDWFMYHWGDGWLLGMKGKEIQ